MDEQGICNNKGRPIERLEPLGELDELAEVTALNYFDDCFEPEVAAEESYYELAMTQCQWKPYGFWRP